MSTRRARAQLVPNANDPTVLIRLIGLIAAGLRRREALAEVLDVELRTVNYYTQAGEWLGLLSTEGDVHLTPKGVELAFADPRRRLKLYAEAVWRNDFARALLAGQRSLPDADTIARFIVEQEPGLASSTARRRASAVRSLLEPAFEHRPSRRKPQGTQLSLPFGLLQDQQAREEEPVNLKAGLERSPDVYARLYRALLDHGELSTSQLRALLDRIGGGNCPLGPYAEMAVRRGDARRQGDRLIVTPGAVKRRELAEDGVLIALTDPDYRKWLSGLIARARGEVQDPDESAGGIGARVDAAAIIAAREHARLGRRYATWDVRIFGHPLKPSSVRSALEHALPGRDPLSLPGAGDPGSELPFEERPFLEALDVMGLPIALPSSLSAVAGGVATLNGELRRLRSGPANVRLPGPLDRRSRVHGGVLHPGEGLPRAIPDNQSLRTRLLNQTPALSMFAALLLMDRRVDLPLRIVDRGSGPLLRWSDTIVGPLVETLDAFSVAQGWTCSRPLRSGLDGATLEAAARALGICTRAGRRVIMEEALFVRLQEDVEARLTYEALLPLIGRLQAWLDEEAPRTDPDDLPPSGP